MTEMFLVVVKHSVTKDSTPRCWRTDGVTPFRWAPCQPYGRERHPRRASGPAPTSYPMASRPAALIQPARSSPCPHSRARLLTRAGDAWGASSRDYPYDCKVAAARETRPHCDSSFIWVTAPGEPLRFAAPSDARRQLVLPDPHASARISTTTLRRRAVGSESEGATGQRSDRWPPIARRRDWCCGGAGRSTGGSAAGTRRGSAGRDRSPRRRSGPTAGRLGRGASR